MNSLKARLHLAEEDFLTALVNGGDALSAFDKRWETLINDIDNTMEVSGLDTETATLAHTTAYRISVLADTCTDLAKSYDTFTSQLMDEITVLMADLTVIDSTVDAPTSVSDSEPPSVSSLTSSSVLTHPSPSTRKRRREDDCALSCKGYRSTKRQRGVDVVYGATPLLGNGSRSSSPSVSSTILLPSTAESLSQVEQHSVRLSRKRRLSDADLVVSSHRAKRVHVGPRLHAVSDSFPTLRPSTLVSEHPARARTVLPPLLHDISSPLLIQPPVTSSQSEEATFFNLDGEFGLATLPELTNIDVFGSPTKFIPMRLEAATVSAVNPIPTTDLPYPLDLPECVFAASPTLSSDSSSSPSPTASCPATPPMCASADFSLPPYSLGFPLSQASAKSEDVLVPIALLPGVELPPSLDALQSSLSLDPFFDPLDPSVWLSAPPPYSHWPEIGDALPQTRTPWHSIPEGLQLDASQSSGSLTP